MSDESLMPFGKYKGVRLAEVPDAYLLWIYENNKCSGGLKNYIEDNLEAIKENIKRAQR